ncbi:uracil-DNA glycosylase [Ottowia thiooxydans]|uniref:uracil-DNA glycosylase n=1 Tax=Ottowia thiooxydans TaxID=219182 RepID=UPI0004104583|nr:uracil-DNA glycosylase [Ottowia thiooxydans]
MLLDDRQRAMLAEMGVRVWAPKVVQQPAQAEADAVRAVEPTPVASPAPVRAPIPEQQPTRPIRQESAAPPQARQAPTTPPAPATPPPRPSVSSEGIERMDWPQLEATVAACRACGLCEGRTQTVFGVGSQHAEWMVVGEAPGENEDRQGEPFVGQAGKLLDNMLAAINLSRQAGNSSDDLSDKPAPKQGGSKESVYIANVLKCRPPGNRNPQPEEIAQCEPYLRRQVALVRPKIILAMGRFAVHSLLQSSEPIGRLRGRVHQYQGVPVIVTYHPAYLLRSLSEKAKAWEDLSLALEVAQGSVVE